MAGTDQNATIDEIASANRERVAKTTQAAKDAKQSQAQAQLHGAILQAVNVLVKTLEADSTKSAAIGLIVQNLEKINTSLKDITARLEILEHAAKPQPKPKAPTKPKKAPVDKG